jgi:hypothetical protein
LVADGLGAPIGGWLVLAALAAMLVAILIATPLPEPSDIVMSVLVLALAAPGLFMLDALNAPRWSAWLLIGAVAVGWMEFQERREGPPSGQIRIPPGFRFSKRRRG